MGEISKDDRALTKVSLREKNWRSQRLLGKFFWQELNQDECEPATEEN